MSRQHRRRPRFKLRSFYVWHRYIGISAALLLIIASVTGILLNHTEEFELDSRFVHADWLLDWYGVKAPETVLTYPAGKRFVTLMGPHLYLNRREIEGNYHRLVGSLAWDGLFIIAVSDSILLITPRGELVEKLGTSEGIPARIQRLGTDATGQPVAQAADGLYSPDADFIAWQLLQANDNDIRWVEAVTADADLLKGLQQHFRQEVLPLERVVLDMHSGRFLGALGPWLMDAAAVALILLALSGSWMWLRRRR